jgi:hypothetical protein
MTGFDLETTDTMVEVHTSAFEPKLVEELRKTGGVNLPAHEGRSERAFYHELGDKPSPDELPTDKPSIRSFQTENGKTTQVLDVALDESTIKLDDRADLKRGGGVFEVNMQGSQVKYQGEELGPSDPRREKVVAKVMQEVTGLRDRLQTHFDDESVLRTEPGF